MIPNALLHMALCGALQAAPAAADSGREAPDTVVRELQELSVGAFKQMAPLRLEAQSATTLTAAQLERIDAVSVKSVSDVVPNFFMPDYGSRITSSMYVRGIGARMDQPAVTLNVDNVPYLNKDAYDFDIADIAELQMLRGPQSTLFGRNAMGGTINVTTLSPFRFQGWKALADVSSRGRVKLGAGAYHKFNPRAGVSLNVGASTTPGEFRNSHTGRKLDWERSLSLRSKQQWRSEGGTSVFNTASASWLRQGGYPYESFETGRIAYNDTCFYRRFTFADGLTVSRSGERAAFTSVTSVQVIDDNMTLDQDFTTDDFFTLTQTKREWAVTHEAVVRSADTGAKWQWIAGAFGFFKHLDMQAPVTFKDKGIADLIESHRNDANPDYPITWDSRTFPLLSDFTLPTWGLAAFHESHLKLGAFTLTAGLRLDYEHAALRYTSSCSTGYTIWHREEGLIEPWRRQAVEINDRGRYSRHFLTLLPSVSALWELPAGKGNVYAKVSEGYKAGGYNTQMFSDVLQQRVMNIMGIGSQYNIDDIVGYKPEYSWNAELGAHLDFAADGAGSYPRASVDVTAYLTFCRDQQITVFPSGNTTGRMMANAGRTRNRGGEAAVTFEPSARWAFNVSYGFTDARFVRFFNGIQDFRGKAVPYAPRNTLFAQAIWTKPLSAETKLSADVNLRGTGKIFWNEANTRTQPFYLLAGAGATLTRGNLTLALWGKNLTGTRHHTFYFLSMGREFRQRGRGAEAGLTLRLTI